MTLPRVFVVVLVALFLTAGVPIGLPGASTAEAQVFKPRGKGKTAKKDKPVAKKAKAKKTKQARPAKKKRGKKEVAEDDDEVIITDDDE